METLTFARFNTALCQSINHFNISPSLYIFLIDSLKTYIDTQEKGKMRVKITFLFYILLVLPLALADLRVGFYKAVCPRAESIVRASVQRVFNRDKSIPAALLRMHFHDCFVRVSFDYFDSI